VAARRAAGAEIAAVVAGLDVHQLVVLLALGLVDVGAVVDVGVDDGQVERILGQDRAGRADGGAVVALFKLTALVVVGGVVGVLLFAAREPRAARAAAADEEEQQQQEEEDADDDDGDLPALEAAVAGSDRAV
jgi:hypothetical protein